MSKSISSHSETVYAGRRVNTGTASTHADKVERQNQILRICFWFTAVVLGGGQAWIGRHTVAEDGLSYIEVGEAYFRGDWANAINGYWSPLYSWILGFVLKIVQPARVLESSVVHLANFVIFIGAVAAFDFLLRESLRYKNASDSKSDGLIALSDRAWTILGYTLFLCASLNWISVAVESPDMLLSAFLYVAAALLIRIRRTGPSPITFAALGGVLGIGYLTKSAMFPLSFVFLVVGFFLVGNRALALRRIGLAAAVFLAVGGPFIAALSISKGRITFGDSGKLAYAWYANSDGALDEVWHLEFPDDKRPEHPTKKIFDTPTTYEYGFAIGGTYPPYYDPSYWHSGVTPHLDVRGQFQIIKRSVRQYLQLFTVDMPFLIFGAIILYACVGDASWIINSMRKWWLLLAPAFAAFAMYGLVRVTPRYVGAFFVLFWSAIFLAIRLPESKGNRRLMDAVAFSILLLTALHFGPNAYAMINSIRYDVDASQSWQWKIAKGLDEAGIKAGDKVAVVGYAPSAYWARLAKVQVVSEVFSEQLDFLSVKKVDQMLSEDGALKPEIVEAFERTGARALVAKNVPAEVARHGWKDLGIAPWWVYPLPNTLH